MPRLHLLLFLILRRLLTNSHLRLLIDTINTCHLSVLALCYTLALAHCLPLDEVIHNDRVIVHHKEDESLLLLDLEYAAVVDGAG